MKKLDFSKYVPLGVKAENELMWVGAANFLSLLYSLLFFLRYSNEADWAIYEHYNNVKKIREGAIMTDFIEIVRPYLVGFWIIAVCVAFLIIYHYTTHFGETKSIYTMRRLPSRWELAKRCAVLPLMLMAATVLLGFIMLTIYYLCYMWLTPDKCTAPNQWSKIWQYGLIFRR